MKKILFIVNPISGGKSKRRIVALINRLLTKSRFSYEIRYTERAGHALELARDADADLVVAVGGDGTVSEVARGLILSRQPKTFGIIPCGSGDGLALHLGIPRRPAKAIAVLNEEASARMDYATVNGEPFFCTTGVGFDADVAEAFASSGRRGLFTYIATALRLWMHFEPQTYSITVDGETVETSAAIVTVGNVNQWGNQARITPLASLTDGMLDVTVVRPFHLWNVPRLAFLLLTGKAHKAREVRLLRGREVRSERKDNGAAHRDGDPFPAGRILTAKIIPSALSVTIPAKMQGRI